MCEITHILQDSTGVPFTLNMEKIPLTLKFLHPRRGWRGRQISGMVSNSLKCVRVCFYECEKEPSLGKENFQ